MSNFVKFTNIVLRLQLLQHEKPTLGSNYFALLSTYCGCDSSLLLDILRHYFRYLFDVCGLSPAYYLTSASFALDCALYNSKSPPSYQKPLEIEVLNEQVYREYEKSLIGGFSLTNCNYNHFRGLEIGPSTEVSEAEVRLLHFIDVNRYRNIMTTTFHVPHYQGR